MKLHTIAVLLLSASVVLSGCKKNETPDTGIAAGTIPATGMMADAARKATVDAKVAALPKPDMVRPLSEYAKLDSGESLMFLYLAAARLPLDYDAIAKDFSSDYRNSSDSFQKHDLLIALKPQIDQRVAAAAQQPYAWMAVDESGNLGAYDFKRGGFPVAEFLGDKTRYFNDLSDYRLSWTNGEALAFAPVKDEAVAREIESLRIQYDQSPELKVYFFAQSVDLQSKVVKAFVTRVQITDRNGRVLSEYGPDDTPPSASNLSVDGGGVASVSGVH